MRWTAGLFIVACMGVVFALRQANDEIGSPKVVPFAHEVKELDRSLASGESPSAKVDR